MFREAIAENVRHYAETKEIPLRTLADLAGIAQETLFRLLRGDNSSIEVVERIAEALEVDPGELCRTQKR